MLQHEPLQPSQEAIVAKEPTKETALEKVLKLQAEMAKIAEEAKAEALAQAEAAIETLNSLGGEYYLGQGGAPYYTDRLKKTVKRAQKTEGECPICQFATEKFHDGRQHRKQGNDKRPFTDEELMEMGMRRV